MCREPSISVRTVASLRSVPRSSVLAAVPQAQPASGDGCVERALQRWVSGNHGWRCFGGHGHL